MNTDDKTCPFCAETIKSAAVICRYCHSDLTVEAATDTSAKADVHPVIKLIVILILGPVLLFIAGGLLYETGLPWIAICVWLSFGVVTALAASARGRSAGGWLILGSFFSVFALIAVLVTPNLAKSN
ncbi:MAG TPA: hypothetical protein VJA19_17540 [Pseudomonas sp.]|nr:hypothetical protein [Pseudomonas sp.]